MANASTELTAANVARCMLAAGALVALAGCALPGQMAGLSDAAVDPSSPVAKDVIAASRHPGPYPKFASIPNVPADVRSDSAWLAAFTDMQRRQAVLDSQVAALAPAADDTEAFASGARTRLGPAPRAAASADAADQTEAYARTLRERATPPPPPK